MADYPWRCGRAIWELPIPASERAYPPRRLFSLEPIPLGAEIVDFDVHPPKQGFGRGSGDPRSLQLKDFLPLAPELQAHVFDFEVLAFFGPWLDTKRVRKTAEHKDAPL